MNKYDGELNRERIRNKQITDKKIEEIWGKPTSAGSFFETRVLQGRFFEKINKRYFLDMV